MNAKHVAVEALAVLDQRVEAAWDATLSDGRMSVKVTHFLRLGNPCDVWAMSDDELRHVISLAMIGHTYMCRQKMLGDNQESQS